MEGQGGMLPSLRERLVGAPAIGRRQAILLAPLFADGAAIYMTLVTEPDLWSVVRAVLPLLVLAIAGWR